MVPSPRRDSRPFLARTQEPEPPDAVYTWVTTDGDSLDLRSVADQIRDTSDQGEEHTYGGPVLGLTARKGHSDRSA